MLKLRENWKICCTKVPKGEVVFVCQVTIALIIIIAGILNITLTDNDTCLWSTLVSGAAGYLLPGPQIRRDEPLLHDTSVEFVDGVPPEQHDGEIHDESV